MAFQDDKFGHKAYTYTPATDNLIERNPDKLRSGSELRTFERGNEIIQLTEVKDLGVLVMRSTDKEFNGLSIFTNDDINFEQDEILGNLREDIRREHPPQ